MKIEIHKEGSKAVILLDGKPVENGCMGFEVVSNGGGFATVTLKFVVKDLNFDATVDALNLQDQEASRTTPSLKRFR